MNWTARGLLSLSLLLAGIGALGQQIKVVVRDEKNGRGLRDAVVWVQFYEAPANRALQRIQYKTGSDGIVRFALPAPPPVHLTVSASARPYYEGFVNAATVDIIRNGAVNRRDLKASGPQATACPGEVIFLLPRISWWIRLLAPLEKG
ncbi:MAG: hypothetical protein WA261_10865 [Candidatus Sulfotelmatobacter sp.]